MHTILLFALRRRFIDYVSNGGSAMSLMLRILYVTVLLVNAAMIGWLIDIFITSNAGDITGDRLIQLISAGFCGLWALLEFFPTYTQRSKLVSGVFPVHFMKRWVTNLVYDMITATTVGTVMAFCLIDALSKTYTHAHLANSVLLFGNTLAFVQIAKAFVENVHRKRFLLLIAWAILSSAVVILVVYKLPDDYLLMSGLTFCLASQFTVLAYADRSVAETNNSPVFVSSFSLFRQLSPVYVAFLNSPKSRNAFLFGLGLKAMFLSFAGIFTFDQLPMSSFLEALYVAPLILFTYVANNIWGFFPVLWVNSTLGKRSDNYRIYFQLIALPLLLDLLTTLGIMLYLGKVDSELLVFYALTTIVLSINGLVFSLYKAFYVQSSFNFGQMKNNVNGWSVFTASVLLGLTMLALKTLMTTFIFGLCLIVIFWYILSKVLPSDTQNTYTLYRQLFTNKV
ncbi:hypothetical protein [Spirosoma montaniterrae]|uniref:Uncharacterized protein n=1 Tax=Spirosoma montaniterrae TaxID=1178516 RepID=A0A1P9WRU5_9BACT|nr:hypothetical protein [Spirosoma montaniterrae]AQG78097.1 hypothetical protein AWR27_01260 [Spirosoma montaniterrae]